MLTNPKRTQKALQELSRVFNKLASELSADLNQTIREIESLKREIRTLKSKGPSANTTRTNNSRRRTTSRSKPRGTTGTHATHTSDNQPSTAGNQHSHTNTAPKEETPYVFPQEPYNPPAPPEPALPGNN